MNQYPRQLCEERVSDMFHFTSRCIAVLLAAALPLSAGAASPSNIILMIGDGMGYNQVKAASLYAYGEERGQPYWEFETAGVATYSIENEEGYDPGRAWEEFEWLLRGASDSAATATAISTGVKVARGALQLTPDGERLEGIVDVANRLGKATGVLATVQISHATPAAFAAHVDARGEYVEIARQMIEESPLDVLMGTGHPWYNDDGEQVGGLEPDLYETEMSYRFVGGEELWRAIQEGTAGGDRPWTLIDSTEEIKALANQEELPDRVLALAPVHATLQANRTGPPYAGPYDTPLNDNMPEMSDLMLGALNILSRNSEGFFLMGEGGAIDWAGHANNMGRLIEEQRDFDKAIEAVIQWVEENSSWDDTLLIITADHETGYLWGPDSNPAWNELENRGKGNPPGHSWHTGSHSNSLVPVFAKGAGAERLHNFVRGEDPRYGPFVDNTDIHRLMMAAWGQDQDTDSAE